MVILFGNDLIVSDSAVFSLLCFWLSLFIISLFVFLLASSPVKQFCVLVLKKVSFLILGVDNLSDGKRIFLVGKFNFFNIFLPPELGFQRWWNFGNGFLHFLKRQWYLLLEFFFCLHWHPMLSLPPNTIDFFHMIVQLVYFISIITRTCFWAISTS